MSQYKINESRSASLQDLILSSKEESRNEKIKESRLSKCKKVCRPFSEFSLIKMWVGSLNMKDNLF